MLLSWRNGFLLVGRDVLRGPFSWCVRLCWNLREDIEGAAPPEGEFRFMDHVQVAWEWPRLEGKSE